MDHTIHTRSRVKNVSFMFDDYSDNRYARHHTPRAAKKEDGCMRARKSLFKAGHDFCLETSIHGFNHIATPRRHWFERLLWACVTAAAIWGAVDISLGQWQRFNDNPTVVTLEKDFRTWKFSLPAITMCNANKTDPAMVTAVIKDLWGVEPGHEKYPYYRQFVDDVANSHILDLAPFKKYSEDLTLEVDLFRLAVNVTPELKIKTTWADGQTPRWIPIMTEKGICHVTNSLAMIDIAIVKTDVNDTKDFPLTCQYPALSCYVIMEILSNITFVVHSPYDIVDVTTPTALIFLTMNKKSELSVLETRCGEGVRGLAVKRRGCLYVDEPVSENRHVYSSNMCRRTCRNNYAFEKCGCNPFYNFYEEGRPCSTAGMACLANYSPDFPRLKCTCMLQCVDAVFKELAHEEQFWDKGPFVLRGVVRYTVEPPRTRYTREIVFHFQDLVVSFGGAAGLFLGASFLSFVEIFYFVFERLLRGCFKNEAQVKAQSLKPAAAAASRPPYEATRIMELNSILENDGRLYDRILYRERF